MSQESLEDELLAAMGIVVQAIAKLHEAVVVLDSARDTAAARGKPTDGFETLRKEMETLQNIMGEQVVAMLRKMAEEEAGSRG
jgi:hypothetical protein